MYINLDETPVPVCFTHIRGNVIRESGKEVPRQSASRRDTRMYFTLIAMICSESALQALLPQIIVVGKKTLRVKDVRAVKNSLPNNVYLLHEETGWNNERIQRDVVELVKLSLGDILNEYQVIWLSDACKCHLGTSVMEALARSDFWYGVVPAQLTGLLQPLDVATFVIVKRVLKEDFSERLGNGDERPPVVCMIDAVVRCIQNTINAYDWSSAFAYVGCMGAQDDVGKSLKREVGWRELPAIPRGRPRMNEVQLCMPRGLRMESASHASCLPVEEAAALPEVRRPLRRLRRKSRSWLFARSDTEAEVGEA